MPKSNVLSIQEIEAFLDRVRATVAAAQEAEGLKAAIARVLEAKPATVAAPATPAKGRGGRKPAAAAPAPKAPGGKRGRTARVSDSDIVGLLAGAGPNGLTMRDLESHFGQHPETIRLKLRALREQQKVTTSGPRNQLRYHAAGAPVAEAAQAPAAAPKKKGGRKAAAKAAPAKKGPGRKAAAQGGEEFKSQILGIVRNAAGAGVQMSTLTEHLKADPKTIRKVLDGLKAAGSVNVTGHRRSTRYFIAG